MDIVILEASIRAMVISAIAKRVKAGGRNDRATSPAVGAILLVGITVVLATTVGAQMFSFTGTEQKPFATANVEYNAGADRMTVTWRSNMNAEAVRVKVHIGNQHHTITLNHVGHTVTVDSTGITVRKGKVTHWDQPSATDGKQVSVTVTAVKDGNTAVLAERTETI